MAWAHLLAFVAATFAEIAAAYKLQWLTGGVSVWQVNRMTKALHIAIAYFTGAI